MSEFVDRMALQRRILRAVNSRDWEENLHGLSDASISRWQKANSISSDAVELMLIRSAANALSFLATRSQDQVSDDYERVSLHARAVSSELRRHFESGAPSD